MHIIIIVRFIFWRTCRPSDISTLRMYFPFELWRLGGCNTNPWKPQEKSKSPAPFTGKCPRSCNPRDFPIQISASEHISFCVSIGWGGKLVHILSIIRLQSLNYESCSHFIIWKVIHYRPNKPETIFGLWGHCFQLGPLVTGCNFGIFSDSEQVKMMNAVWSIHQ